MDRDPSASSRSAGEAENPTSRSAGAKSESCDSSAEGKNELLIPSSAGEHDRSASSGARENQVSTSPSASGDERSVPPAVGENERSIPSGDEENEFPIPAAAEEGPTTSADGREKELVTSSDVIGGKKLFASSDSTRNELTHPLNDGENGSSNAADAGVDRPSDGVDAEKAKPSGLVAAFFGTPAGSAVSSPAKISSTKTPSPSWRIRAIPQLALLFAVLFIASLSVSLYVGSQAFHGISRTGTTAGPRMPTGQQDSDSPYSNVLRADGAEASAAQGYIPPVPDPSWVQGGPSGSADFLRTDLPFDSTLREFPVRDPRFGPDDETPILAVVIDDWGYGWQAARDFLSFDRPLTVAVLPYLPYSRTHAHEAHARGHQVILHLPMEPLGEQWDLGEGAVTTAKTSSEIVSDVLRALAAVPYVSGVNNHMGSKATADRRVMAEVLKVINENGLFFLDSRTTTASVAGEVGKELGALVLANDRFIDTDNDSDRIKERILLGAQLAKRRGYAIVIGHVRPETYRGLMASLPELDREGVRLAYLSDVLRRVYPQVGREGLLVRQVEPPVDEAGKDEGADRLGQAGFGEATDVETKPKDVSPGGVRPIGASVENAYPPTMNPLDRRPDNLEDARSFAAKAGDTEQDGIQPEDFAPPSARLGGAEPLGTEPEDVEPVGAGANLEDVKATNGEPGGAGPVSGDLGGAIPASGDWKDTEPLGAQSGDVEVESIGATSGDGEPVGSEPGHGETADPQLEETKPISSEIEPPESESGREQMRRFETLPPE